MNDYTGLEILWALLIDLNLGTNPELNQPWPVFIGILPDIEKSQSVSLFDIGLPTQGRLQKTGETIGHEGIQIRTTAKNYADARTEMFSICKELDKIVRYTVPVKNDQYEVQAIHRKRQPVYIGQDENDRDSFTVDVSTIAKKVS
jgi:hypothetical protein